MGAGNQIGRRTEPTAEQLLAAERRVAQRPATPFAQSLQAAFHRRLRKCSLSVLPGRVGQAPRAAQARRRLGVDDQGQEGTG